MAETEERPQIPADPRLGRFAQFDDRSLAYPLREIMTATQVKRPRNKRWNFRHRLNQGERPACVGFSIAQEIGAQPYYHNVTDYLAYLTYLEAQKIDAWAGEGYPGTSVLAGMTIAKKMGFYGEFRWALPPDPLLDTILAVGYKGPIVAGTNWYEGMSHPNADGFVTLTGNLLGGHAYGLGEVNYKEKWFEIPNTWGEENYGINGNARLRFADAERLIYENGEIALPLVRT